MQTRRVTYQTPDTRRPDRADHIWFLRPGGGYKCCLCGAVTTAPPPYPTPTAWSPDDYELPLTPTERRVCPYDPSRVL